MSVPATPPAIPPVTPPATPPAPVFAPAPRGARPAGSRCGPTLRQRFDPRANSLSVLRLLLAATVALVHAQELGWRDQPHLRDTPVGDLAVDGFFVISGFLVTRSAVRLRSLRRFLWHRALRILPGFWVCLLVVALGFAPLLAWLQGVPLTELLTGPESAISFVAVNAGLLMRQWGINGLNDAHGDAMNGSLWTLFYEAVCYLVVGACVTVGLLRRHRAGPVRAGRRGTRRWVAAKLRAHGVLLLAVAVLLLHTAHVTGLSGAGPDFLTRVLLLFLLGALGHVYAHRIAFPAPLLALAVVVLGVSLALFEDYRSLGAPAFAYLLLWAVVALPWRWEPGADLSYGLYVYHWPVELALVSAGFDVAGRPAFTVTALALAALLAYGSWRLVERPALRRKDATWLDRLPAPAVAPR